MYPQGAVLIFHVLSDTDPTGGTDHYDDWYGVALTEGSTVYRLKPACLTVTQTSPTYQYSVDLSKGEATTSSVVYTAGTTPYWDVGILYVWPRSTAANLDTYLKHGGTTLSSVSDGSTWVDTDAEITANGTMTTTAEDLTIELRGGAVDICYGLPFYTLSQKGEFQVRNAAIMLSTSMTAIGTSAALNEGWQTFTKPDLTAEVGFYYILPAIIPTRGDKFVELIDFPVDSSAAATSTEFIFKIWILDLQVESYLMQGSSSSSVPTAYGFLNEFGIDAIIYARALTITSNAGDNEVHRAYITTAS
jgi:hypothetical protein